MFDPKRLDDYPVHFVNRKPTPEEDKEFSDFMKARKEKLERKANKLQTNSRAKFVSSSPRQRVAE
jgi:hypothetical protein